MRISLAFSDSIGKGVFVSGIEVSFALYLVSWKNYHSCFCCFLVYKAVVWQGGRGFSSAVCAPFFLGLKEVDRILRILVALPLDKSIVLI